MNKPTRSLAPLRMPEDIDRATAAAAAMGFIFTIAQQEPRGISVTICRWSKLMPPPAKPADEFATCGATLSLAMREALEAARMLWPEIQDFLDQTNHNPENQEAGDGKEEE